MTTEASQPKDGGPAFPSPSCVELQPETTKQGNIDSTGGMSLRDYFAAHADIPWGAVLNTMEIKSPERGGKFSVLEVVENRSQMKYWEADAMLAARERKEDGT